MHEQTRDQQGKNFADRRKKDNYELREQESEKIKKGTKKKRVATRHDEGKKGNNDARVFEA